MGHIPLITINLEGDECLIVEDMLYHAHLENRTRLHSKFISIEYYPELKKCNILAVEWDGKEPK